MKILYFPLLLFIHSVCTPLLVATTTDSAFPFRAILTTIENEKNNEKRLISVYVANDISPLDLKNHMAKESLRLTKIKFDNTATFTSLNDVTSTESFGTLLKKQRFNEKGNSSVIFLASNKQCRIPNCFHLTQEFPLEHFTANHITFFVKNKNGEIKDYCSKDMEDYLKSIEKPLPLNNLDKPTTPTNKQDSDPKSTSLGFYKVGIGVATLAGISAFAYLLSRKTAQKNQQKTAQ